MAWKKSFLVTWIVCAAFLLAVSAKSMAAWGGKELETEKIAVNFAREAIKGGYKIVSTEELKGWTDQKKDMLIVDTMPYEDSYKKQHIPGAVHFEFPVKEVANFDDKTKSDFAKILGPNKDRVIVIYCGFTKCGRSHNGAMLAVRLGYKNVYRYPGGITAWAEADYPIEKAK
jgi:thiosulfate/3-mercaptopyruvate sulfurtransferase